MEINHFTCVNCNIKSEAFTILNQTELDSLEEGCSQVVFKKGELIIKEGTPAIHIVYIRNGFVKLHKNGFGDKEYILNISKKGDYLNSQNIHTNGNLYYFSASAITPANVCFIEIKSFVNLLKRNGLFAYEVIAQIFNNEMNYFDRLMYNIQQQIPGRLAGALLYFKNQVYKENPFTLNLTRTELASFIGTTRESVSRLIKEFHNLGIINTEKNNITILDEKRLNDIKFKG